MLVLCGHVMDGDSVTIWMSSFSFLHTFNNKVSISHFVIFFKSTPEEEEEVCSETVCVLLFYQFDICHYFITSYKISCVNFSCKILICLKSDSGVSVKTCSFD